MKKMKFAIIAGSLLLLTLGVLLSNRVNANLSPKQGQPAQQNAEAAVPFTVEQPELPLKDQIAQWIQQQGERDEYYLEALSYTEVQLDMDNDLEIIAGIDGGAHLGQFFIFDRSSEGSYRMITEKDWKVEQLHPGLMKDVELTMLFETVEHTGGTGIDVQIAHLWYLKDGEFKEAWEGRLKERNAMMTGSHSLLAASYQVIENWLYSWETFYTLADDDVTNTEPPRTTMKRFEFNGEVFELVDETLLEHP